MDDRGFGSGPVTDVLPITGGTQNMLVRFRRDDREYVLRRPPLHKRPHNDETMMREARVLGLLAGTEVPHPELIAACDDLDVLGACFYLMAPVDGFNPTTSLPYPGDRASQHRMGLAMVDGLAALADVDVSDAGGLGRADGWLERQVGRWGRQLASYRELPGYAGGGLPGVDRVAAWLEAHRPARATIGLIHGDFHFANVLFRSGAPRLAAVLDWELSTLGDPLLDLGHLLATWPGGGPGVITDLPSAPGLPGRAELLDHYAERTGRDLGGFGWYQTLACYRLAILLEGSTARAAAGRAPAAVGESCHRMATALLHQAHELLSGPKT